jgi:UDPglucose--hexose-1-phosphate uridylyltransferase
MAPDLLFDPLGRRHVLLAPERANRGAPSYEDDPPDPQPCDFCGEHETQTPPETYAIRAAGTEPDTPGWRVRVVPNLYPATSFHEVVVHTPDHFARFESLDPGHRRDALRAYSHRVAAAGTQTTIVAYNKGRAAGASRTHDHGQIFGLDIVPPTIEREMETFATGPCALCTIANNSSTMITETAGYRVVAHPVPLVADELLIVPPHGPRFEEVSGDDLGPAAETLAEALRRLEAVLGGAVPFNLVFHTAPAGVDAFHWHAHLMPRTARWAALELGAELPIVASDPLDTAQRLRDV